MSPTWHNHTRNQSCNPRAIVHPGSLQDLIGLVQRAERERTTVRAVGAGHSWSDVALTDGDPIQPDHLSGVTRLDESGLREDARGRKLVRVLGGTHLHTLNESKTTSRSNRAKPRIALVERVQAGAAEDANQLAPPRVLPEAALVEPGDAAQLVGLDQIAVGQRDVRPRVPRPAARTVRCCARRA